MTKKVNCVRTHFSFFFPESTHLCLNRRKQLGLGRITYREHLQFGSSPNICCVEKKEVEYVECTGETNNTVIPRLTKIIRSGITFVSRNLR